ncbi:carbon starvation protein CstA [Anoxybacter fermentans]|uniref:Carbon starvation protein CstA n=1 Tax=Anoxybacter fermentans TaxID=1323375 RepID=A0A3Q9HRN8_9FIRM|nr:carbon starvation protein A [Anoxybacter fermentans]AZR74140.1 carbon starvation protein CstA [Anoxybacter fermentans]
MITFIGAIILLIVGYFIYGTVVERVFGADEKRITPAKELEDGVDFVPMPWYKIFLIQFLNIAGLGPIFGAIAGALWGPVAFLWIVFGAIFAGAVHDYLSGMISMRHKGATISEIIGDYLGNNARQVMRIFSLILLILVGTVFMTGPAKLLANLTSLSTNVWLVIIIFYYFLATILPVDKIIGRLYPLFGASLIIMAIGVGGGLIFGDFDIPELVFANLHPKGLSIWPMLFVTIACGAISGFHATQSPMMARCATNEKYGRRIFYGAMIAEGIVALIWAAAAMTFFGGTGGLQEALANGGPAGVVNEITGSMLGLVGGILAMLGVIALPISSGDTAFRSARLQLADMLKMSQRSVSSRLKLAFPLFAIGVTLSQMDFSIIWRYFAWSNQTLAMMALWAGAAYLLKNGRFHWIATIPATFMTAVSVSYIIVAPEGFQQSIGLGTTIGVLTALIALGSFLYKQKSLQ